MLMKLGLPRSVAEDRMSIFLTKLKQKVLMKGGAEEELRKGVDGVADAVIDTVQQSEKITPFLKVLPNFMFVLHNIENTPAFGSLVGAWMDFFTNSLGASTDAMQAIIVNIPGFGQAINFVIGIFVWPFLAMVSLSRKEFSESTESFLKVIPLGIGKAMSMMFAKGDKFFVKMDSRWDKIREQFSTLIENSRQAMNTPKVQSNLESNIGDAYGAQSPAPPPAPAPARTVPAPPPVQRNVSRTTLPMREKSVEELEMLAAQKTDVAPYNPNFSSGTADAIEADLIRVKAAAKAELARRKVGGRRKRLSTKKRDTKNKKWKRTRRIKSVRR